MQEQRSICDKFVWMCQKMSFMAIFHRAFLHLSWFIIVFISLPNVKSPLLLHLFAKFIKGNYYCHLAKFTLPQCFYLVFARNVNIAKCSKTKQRWNESRKCLLNIFSISKFHWIKYSSKYLSMYSEIIHNCKIKIYYLSL